MKLSVIIPVFNEKKEIESLISRVKSTELNGIEKEIVVVDDGSKDGTREILKKIKNIKLILHSNNLGKGAALKSGIKKSTGDIIIIQDADNEYSPKEYPILIRPIIDGKSKVVYGSRILKKNKKGKMHFYIGGRIISIITSLLYRSKITDEPTCYKVFHQDLKHILLKAEGNCFSWEPEVTAKILRKGYKIIEVPISYNPRSKKDGKKIRFKDGLIAIKTLIKWRFKKI